MATLVTVSCDRCGSIIPEVEDRHTASADVRTKSYDSILRESWELCCECFGLVHRTLLDRCGPASDSWKRPEPSLKDEERYPDKAEALRVVERSMVSVEQARVDEWMPMGPPSMQTTRTTTMPPTDKERLEIELTRAVALARASLATLRDARGLIPREAPVGRDVSIAITHLEDALLRLEHGAPPDQP